MRIDTLLIGIVVFSLVVFGGVYMIDDISDNYDKDLDTSDFNASYNKIDETYNLSKDIKDDMFESEIQGTDQSWESSVKNSYSAIRRVKSSFSLIITVLDDVSRTIGIPRFVIVSAVTVLMIAIVFSFIYMVFHFQPR